jgi:hypothetical protein
MNVFTVQDFSIKVMMTEVVIKLNKVNSSEWPRLSCSAKRNLFISYYDVSYTEGMQALFYTVRKLSLCRKEGPFRELCKL